MALPQVGLQAVLVMREFERNARKYDRAMKDINRVTKQTATAVTQGSQSMARSFETLSRNSRVFAEMFDQVKPETFIDFSTQVRQAFDALGRGAQVNIQQFDALLDRTGDVGQSMLIAAGRAEDMEGKVTLLGSTMGIAALAIGATTLALGAFIKGMKKATEEYIEFGKAVQRTSNIMGSGIGEAERWVNILRLMGISQTTAERAISSFARKYTDMVLDIAAGKEATSDFARTIQGMGISIRDSEGNLRALPELLDEAITKLGETEAGALRTGDAVTLFGYAGRDIANLAENFSEIQEAVEGMRGVLSEFTDEQLIQFIIAAGKAAIATQNIANVIGTSVVPAMTELLLVYSAVTQATVDFYALLLTGPVVLDNVRKGTMNVAEALLFYGEEMEKIRKTMFSNMLLSEELGEARADLTLETRIAAEQEKAYREELQKTIDKLGDLADAYGEKMAAAFTRFQQQQEDAVLRSQRSILDQALRLFQSLEEAEQKSADRRADIIARSERRIAELREDWAKAIRRFNEDAADKRESLETRHRERLRQINQRYFDSVDEAARKNDAVAVLRARRRRTRELRDEGFRHGIDVSELNKQLSKQRRRLDEDARDRIRREQQRAQQRLNEIAKEYEDRRKVEREKLQQILALLDDEHRKQFEDLKDSKDLEAQLIKLKLEQRLSDIDRNYQRQRQAATDHYRKERNLIGQELGLHGQEIDRAIRGWGNTAAVATVAAMRQVGNAASRELTAWSRRWLLRSSQGWGGRTPSGGGRNRRAEGGIDVVSSPTTFLAGEAGPEIAAFIPLRGQMSVQHSFGRLGVDINGASGVDQAQIQGLIWRAMTEVAQNLNVSGRH